MSAEISRDKTVATSSLVKCLVQHHASLTPACANRIRITGHADSMYLAVISPDADSRWTRVLTAAKAYIQAEKQLPKASFYQAVYGGSILVDKAQLLAGLPTEITVSHNRVEIAGIDKLGQALSQTLLPSRKEIDVMPTKIDTQD